MYFEKVQDKMHVLTYFEFEDVQAHTYTFLGYFSDSWPDLCMLVCLLVMSPSRAEVFSARLVTFFLQLELFFQLENQKIAIFAAQIFFPYFTCIFTLYLVYSVANNTVSL